MNRKHALGSLVLLLLLASHRAVIAAEPALKTTEYNKIEPLITTAELTVGENRFAFGLVQANALVKNADVVARLYVLDRGSPQLASEVKAEYQSVTSGPATKGVHRHADGTRHVHSDDTAVRGLYVTRLNFYRAGTWGIELLVRQHGVSHEPIRFGS